MNDKQFVIHRSPRPGALLSVHEFGRQRVRSTVTARRLPVFAAVLVERGGGTIETDGAGLQEVAAPGLFWLLPDMLHSYGPHKGTAWDERWVLFSGELAREFVANGLIRPEAPLIALRDAGEPTALFGELHTEMSRRTALADAAAAAAVHRLVVCVAEAASKAPASDGDADRLVQALRDGACTALDLGAFARRFGVSPATLRRRFLAATGLAPKAFQQRVRLDRAKDLLAAGDLPVEAVAAAVGFEDPFYFARVFAQREHCTPSAFRRRNQRF